jgi:hypothetical protein
MLQCFCQIGIVILVVVEFLGLLYKATEDTDGPEAFFGALLAIAIAALLALLFWGAGAFSAL